MLLLNVHKVVIASILSKSSINVHIKTLARGVNIITEFEVPIFLRSSAELIAFCRYRVLLIVQNPKHQMVEDTAMHIAIAHCTSSQKAQQLFPQEKFFRAFLGGTPPLFSSEEFLM